MEQITRDKMDVENLVQKAGAALRELDEENTDRINRTKQEVRRITVPRIKKHAMTVKGKEYVYYTYCQGTDQEIYLGSADMILRAVIEHKQPKPTGE